MRLPRSLAEWYGIGKRDHSGFVDRLNAATTLVGELTILSKRQEIDINKLKKQVAELRSENGNLRNELDKLKSK